MWPGQCHAVFLCASLGHVGTVGAAPAQHSLMPGTQSQAASTPAAPTHHSPKWSTGTQNSTSACTCDPNKAPVQQCLDNLQLLGLFPLHLLPCQHREPYLSFDFTRHRVRMVCRHPHRAKAWPGAQFPLLWSLYCGLGGWDREGKGCCCCSWLAWRGEKGEKHQKPEQPWDGYNSPAEE